MTLQRWNDEMLDQMAQLLTQTSQTVSEASQTVSQMSHTVNHLSHTVNHLSQTVSQLLEGQRMLLDYYQQEHEARVESDRRFNRFMESQEQINREQTEINRRLAEAVEDLRRYFRFSRENGSEN